jgi:2-methylcitrate dehydratase PrpD
MGLDPATIEQAMGIADYHAPNLPMMRDIDHPSMVKHGVGWGAMNGIISAELAERGFTGVPSILGFDKYYDWVADIGREYIMVEGLLFKRWSCCAWGHPAIHATLEAVQKHGISVDKIDRIDIHTFHEGSRLSQRQPASTEEAQFSIKWPLATMLLDGQIGPDQILERRFGDERVRDLVDKMTIVQDPEVERMYRLFCADPDDSPDAIFTSRVTLTLADGREVDSGLVNREDARLDDAGLEEKFRWLAGYVLAEEQIDRVLDTISDFETIADVRELVGALHTD